MNLLNKMSTHLKASIIEKNLISIVDTVLSKSRVHTLTTEQVTTCHITPTGHLVVSDIEKYLRVYSIQEDLNISEKGNLFLPKKVTHSWIDGSRLFFCDKYGDINSVDVDEIRELKEGEDAQIQLETGNFCTMTAARLQQNSRGERFLITADEYYKVRVFDYPNIHSLKTSIAFRLRFVTSLQLYKDNLLLGFDDQEAYMVKQGQIESSNSTE